MIPVTTRLTMLCLPALLLAAGCSAPDRAEPTPPLAFEAGTYPVLFDAARESLAHHRFVLDRVDAARGVITTHPKRTAGLATPWDKEQSALSQEAEDLAHQQERVCRVIFLPPEAPNQVAVEVVVQRIRRPGWRIETDAIRYSTHAADPAARRAGDEPQFAEPIGEDRALAERILADIRARAGLADLAAAPAE